LNKLEQPVLLYQSIIYPTVEKIEYQQIDKPILYAQKFVNSLHVRLMSLVVAKNTIAREVM